MNNSSTICRVCPSRSGSKTHVIPRAIFDGSIRSLTRHVEGGEAVEEFEGHRSSGGLWNRSFCKECNAAAGRHENQGITPLFHSTKPGITATDQKVSLSSLSRSCFSMFAALSPALIQKKANLSSLLRQPATSELALSNDVGREFGLGIGFVALGNDAPSANESFLAYTARPYDAPNSLHAIVLGHLIVMMSTRITSSHISAYELFPLHGVAGQPPSEMIKVSQFACFMPTILRNSELPVQGGLLTPEHLFLANRPLVVPEFRGPDLVREKSSKWDSGSY